MTLKSSLKQFLYRCWQFYKAINPDFNQLAWNNVYSNSDGRLQPLLNELGKAEKAHVLRILKYIDEDITLSESEKINLSDFAIVHDIGKAITKPSLAFKVAKVLFKLNGNAHCIEGAKAIWRITRNKTLALQVLRHHVKPNNNALIAKFQKYDDKA